MSDDTCKVEFRYLRNHIYKVINVMNFPDTFTCYNGLKFDAVEGICIFLKRFAYPCRYLDMIPRFAKAVSQFCLISNLVMDHAYTHWNHSLPTFNQHWLSANCIETFPNAIFQKSGALQNCLGFVDGTVRPVFRPSRNQQVLYNGHKNVHALKFQSVAVPTGLVANLYSPVEGKRHHSAMLAESGLYNRPTLILTGLGLAAFLKQARPFGGLAELVAGII